MQDECNTEEGLFEMMNNTFKLQYDEIIMSSQFHKPMRQAHENTEKWMAEPEW